MMKFAFKWLLRLAVLVVVLAVIFFLSLDTILRVTAEHRIRAQTGMDAEIGTFHFGLLEPVVTIKDLKLHNPPAFGGTPFLNIPEIHVEYDRDALRAGKIHLTLLRFNLGELDIVKNEAGQMPDELEPPFADEAAVERGAAAVRAQHGDEGERYLQTLARYNSHAWPGIVDVAAQSATE